MYEKHCMINLTRYVSTTPHNRKRKRTLHNLTTDSRPRALAASPQLAWARTRFPMLSTLIPNKLRPLNATQYNLVSTRKASTQESCRPQAHKSVTSKHRKEKNKYPHQTRTTRLSQSSTHNHCHQPKHERNSRQLLQDRHSYCTSPNFQCPTREPLLHVFHSTQLNNDHKMWALKGEVGSSRPLEGVFPAVCPAGAMKGEDSRV